MLPEADLSALPGISKAVIFIKKSIYILIAGVLWGIISIFVTRLKEMGFSSMQIVAIRVLFSAVIMTLFLLITDRKSLKIKLRDMPWFVGTGIGSIAFFNFCYFEAIEIIGGAAVPALLLYTSPIFVMIMSLIFFHEKFTAKKIAALVITFAGLVLVTGAFFGNSVPIYAVFLGLGSGFGYALYSIFGKVLLKKYNSSTITVFTFIVAAVFMVPFSGLAGKAELLLSANGLLSSVALAIVCTVIPFFLYTKGLADTDAGKAAILATIEPFAAAVVGLTVFHEEMTLMKAAGMALVLIAIILLNANFQKRNQ